MTALVVFRNGRLFVGHRACDYSEVWYAPIGEAGDDGDPKIGLYSSPIGGAGYREPMESEVIWITQFDLMRCDAKTLPAKRTMQRQILYDAWIYMREKTPTALRRLEAMLDDPDNKRWQSWFNVAKKQKQKTITAAETRTRNREAYEARRRQAAKKGIAFTEPEPNEDVADDDSAFDEDEVRSAGPHEPGLRPFGSGSGGVGLMGPPRLPAGSKRMRDQDDVDGDSYPGTPGAPRHSFTSQHAMRDLNRGSTFRSPNSFRSWLMSGGLGARSTSPGSIDDEDDDDNGDDNDISLSGIAEMYDTRNPDDQQSEVTSHRSSAPPAMLPQNATATPNNSTVFGRLVGRRGANSELPANGLPTPNTPDAFHRATGPASAPQNGHRSSPPTAGSSEFIARWKASHQAAIQDADKTRTAAGNGDETARRLNGIDDEDTAMNTGIRLSNESHARESMARDSVARDS